MTEIIFCGTPKRTGEYCPKEGLVNGVVRFGKVDKAYIMYAVDAMNTTKNSM